MVKQFTQAALLAATLAAAGAAAAGEFSVLCSYRNDNLQNCASVVSDVVSDKFVAKFPASKYQIFVHSDMHSFTNGGFAAYAVAGVTPKGSAQFPLATFSTTNVNSSDKLLNKVELAELELKNYRAAVRSVMEACEISPGCDIYKARK